MTTWKYAAAIGATLAIAFALVITPARPAIAADSIVRAELLQVTVGDVTSLYAVVFNNDVNDATIDIRISVPAGSEILANYAGLPGDNPGAYGDNEIGWINTAVPGNGKSFGPFSLTYHSTDPVRCSHVTIYYNTGTYSGTYVSQELCTTSFISSTGGYTQPAN